MSKKLHLRPFDGLDVQFLALLASAASDPLPHNPRLLRAAMRAVLTGWKQENPARVTHVRCLLHVLAGIERDWSSELTDTSRRDRERRLYGPILSKIASERPRGSHLLWTLGKQRDLLAHYLEAEPCEVSDRSAVLQNDWVKEHWGDLLKLLLGFPCYCSYMRNLDLEQINRKVKKQKRPASKSPGKLLLALLAYFHNAEPSHIQKLLKREPK